jgi:hypothetical protein
MSMDLYGDVRELLENSGRTCLDIPLGRESNPELPICEGILIVQELEECECCEI